jgi:methyl-accepting chemotaxis protein
VTTSPLVVSTSPSIAKPFAFTATALVVAAIAVMFIVGIVSMQHLNGHIATVSSALETAPQADQMKTSLEDLQSGAREVRSAFIFAALGLALLLSICAFAGCYRIAQPLRQLTEIAEKVAGGDLTIELKRAKVMDEVGRLTKALNMILRDMHNALKSVAVEASHLGGASEELLSSAQSTQQVAQGITDSIGGVSRSSGYTLTSVSQMQESLSQNAMAISSISQTIEDIATFSASAAQEGDAGRHAAQDAVKIMTSAADSVHLAAEQLKELGEKTSQIGDFTTIITGIADQTNLLALNAAIEAARAGDAGRGFAVVAEEVRKLAEESNQASRSITKLVQAIENGMLHALSSIHTSDEQVGNGSTSVNNTASILDTIVHGLDEISTKVQSVSAASQQISASSSEMLSTVETVTKFATENAGAAKNVSHATEDQLAQINRVSEAAREVAGMSKSLQATVAKFAI